MLHSNEEISQWLLVMLRMSYIWITMKYNLYNCTVGINFT
jgi:hypothetical protein